MPTFCGIAGAKHKLSKLYCGVDGAVKPMKEFWAGYNGAKNKVFSSYRPISSIPVGNIINAPYGGITISLIVVHQGLPQSSDYDNSCNGTWVLYKSGWGESQFSADGSNSIDSSYVQKYMEDNFLTRFPSRVSDFIKEVKIPYRKGTVQAMN